MIVSSADLGTSAFPLPARFFPGDRVAYLTDGGRTFRLATVEQVTIRTGAEGCYPWRYAIRTDHDGALHCVAPRMLRPLSSEEVVSHVK